MSQENTTSETSTTAKHIKPQVLQSTIVHPGFLEIQEDVLLLPPFFVQQYKYYQITSDRDAVFVLATTKNEQNETCLLIHREYRHPTCNYYKFC